MLELVFVIIVAGILAATMIPRFDRDNLQEAADQLISHIRYTQHLAMIDNKFNTKDSQWFKSRWTISFYKNLSFTTTICTNGHYNNIWAYTIFSDTPTYTGKPTMKEMARNPINPDQFLSGGYNNTLCIDNSDNTDDNQSIKSMRLGEKYGIKDVQFNGGCSAARRIAFDYIGRPFQGDLKTSSKPYQIGRIITSQCQIALCKTKPCSDDKNVTIAIEPETGYTHIL